MSKAKPLDYAGRCERYARQRGWHYDEHRLSIDHLTPRQRRRAIKKERHAWPLYSRRAIDMPWNCLRLSPQEEEAAAAEIERRFLGDLSGWKPAGLLPPSRPSQREEPS